MITLAALRPLSTAYGAYSNTESANRREVAVSAAGIESPASGVIGKRDWVSVVQSWFRTQPEARGHRGRWVLWWHRDIGADGDLVLNLAVRSQHDGIDWDRLVGPIARNPDDGIDCDWAREQGERVP